MADLLVGVSTIVFFLLSSVLALFLTDAYAVRRQRSYLYWSIGLWLFALTDLFEMLFAFGTYASLMGQVYLFVVAFMVIPLAMGSLELIKTVNIRRVYLGYSVVTVLLLAYFTFSVDPGNIVVGSVVGANIPINVIIYSSLITFPAMVVLIVVALLSSLRTKRKKMLWIVLGMLVFGVSGTLYIAAFPAAVYYGEFIGLVMLWLGFFDFSVLKRKRQATGRKRTR